jgi:uncharacterized protein (DUF1330 family)
MAAYVLVSYDIVDSKGFEPYVPAVLPILQKHGVQIVVGDFEGQALEGEAAGVNVVLRFASREAALEWYNDPEYAPVKQIRLDSTANNRMTLVDEFRLPE